VNEAKEAYRDWRKRLQAEISSLFHNERYLQEKKKHRIDEAEPFT